MTRHVTVLLALAIVSTSIPAIRTEAAESKAPAPIQVHDAWARLQPPAGRNTAAFMVLENRGTQADALLGGSCDCAQALELHVMADKDGKMSMRQVDRLDLAPGKSVALAPGGAHVMLIGLTAPMAADHPLHLRLRFERAGEIELTVPVRDPRAKG